MPRDIKIGLILLFGFILTRSLVGNPMRVVSDDKLICSIYHQESVATEEFADNPRFKLMDDQHHQP